MTGTQRDAINILKMMDSVTVNADLIAQALGMNPGVLRKHVKDGDYLISKVEICGDRIRFFREDFLRQIGEMPPEEAPAERTIVQALDDLREELHDIGLILRAQLSIGPALLLEELKAKEKTAGAATPTDVRKEH